MPRGTSKSVTYVQVEYGTKYPAGRMDFDERYRGYLPREKAEELFNLLAEMVQEEEKWWHETQKESTG